MPHGIKIYEIIKMNPSMLNRSLSYIIASLFKIWLYGF